MASKRKQTNQELPAQNRVGTVPLRKTRAMHLRTEIGIGTIEGVPFELATNVDGSMLVQFGPSGTWPERQYTVGMRDFIDAAFAHDRGRTEPAPCPGWWIVRHHTRADHGACQVVELFDNHDADNPDELWVSWAGQEELERLCEVLTTWSLVRHLDLKELAGETPATTGSGDGDEAD